MNHRMSEILTRYSPDIPSKWGPEVSPDISPINDRLRVSPHGAHGADGAILDPRPTSMDLVAW